MDCGVFAANRILVKRVVRKWRKGGEAYEDLPALRLKEANELCDRENEECGEEMVFSRSEPNVTVVVGKERRVFKVDQRILDDEIFRSLIKKTAENRSLGGGIVLLEHCDSILFEHMLWLLYNDDDPSLLRVNLEELVEFYAQDAT